MATLYLDCFSGISGNMLLGALLDAGGDAGHLQSELGKLPLPEWQLHIERRLSHGISGTYVQVLDGRGRPWEEAAEPGRIAGQAGHGPGAHGAGFPSGAGSGASGAGHGQTPDGCSHGYSHAHGEENRVPGGCGCGLSHGHVSSGPATASSPAPGAANRPCREAAHHHTSFREIRAMLVESPLPSRVKETALAVFTALAQAEGRVHGRSPEDAHFHEVGAVDSIIDIVGAAVLLQQLGVEKVLCSPVPTGGGYVRCAHGLLPVPAPATAILLQGVPLRPCPVQAELTTPTGAALVRVLAQGFGPLPAGTYRTVGYGLGSREIGQPNALRVFLYEQALAGGDFSGCRLPGVAREAGGGLSPAAGNSLSGGITIEEIAVLTTHLDDCPPEWYSALFELLFSAGALDVAVTPAQMKKNRPGHALTVLCHPALSHELALLILKHSPALGVRCRLESRYVLPRREEKIATPLGEVAVKISYGPDGSVWHVKPAADEVKELAARHGLSVEQVQRLVWRCLGEGVLL
ncbi:nickel pincer cofactor biosynthesis protein LarC [Desulfurispora thermophila]|uniref:nickel pincer cofactor biosynthesis protein LarC n=1 Tax=Desulfurispora thermophila TaxID=265470 RepID=UPI00037F5793|nr:nickel pincer cofactor biosynthesis protein LarC [Desulfurispora thermophila]